eukprot:CAMPEP_0116558562 /NCGR_PEP_ID=MMETSP0397-20121206/9876_1 /TAXON_ID=216820 /ORGANISM="Cyclophora tenuis, Strain ECT3854" /LENGTH=165 /DNA_ID=CAMNT_0004084167 /DNA_START=8 /DNA_END=505 /DNA_ORIENTATION=-
MMDDSWKSKLLPIIGDADAQELWFVTSFVTPAYLLLAVFPRWKHTHLFALIVPALHGGIYWLSLMAFLGSKENQNPNASFFSLEGVYELFRDPNAVFAGWIHYLAFDLLVARGISLDALERGATNVVYYISVVPCLFFCLMFGPVGFLMYLPIRAAFLSGKEKED